METIEMFEIVERLEKIEKIDLDQRLSYIESQLKNFSYVVRTLNDSFSKGINLNIDSSHLKVVEPIQAAITMLRNEVNYIRDIKKELRETLQDESVIGCLKFMAKQIKELTHTVNSIKDEGLKKNIHLDFTVDGYEMVKKKIQNIAHEESENDPEESTKKLLETLDEREQKILIHRFGLLNHEKMKQKDLGVLLKLSTGRISDLQEKILLKCRTSYRKTLSKNLTHLELRSAILGA